MTNLPLGQILLLIIAALIYLGVAERVLDRMRLSDRAALLIIAAMFVGSFLPSVPLGGLLEFNIGGALIPIAICLYLIITADKRVEKVRAILASVIAAAAIIFTDKILPIEPGALYYDIDPLFVPAIIAGGVAYALGRSRRSAFIAGVFGVVLSDILAVGENLLRGATGIGVEIGGAGVFDAVLLAGVFAVVLAELTGEIYEWLSRNQKRKPPRFFRRFIDRLQLTNAIGIGGQKGKRIMRFSLIAALVLAVFLSGNALINMAKISDELTDGSYYKIVDDDGDVIAKTGRRVYVGDQYISSDNNLYEVEVVDGLTARATLVRQVDLLATQSFPIAKAQPVQLRDLFRFFTQDIEEGAPEGGIDPEEGLGDEADELEGEPLGRVAFYHTHNAESYVTSDGAHSIYGKGGIHQVGLEFKESLEQQGVETIYSQNLHLPHDRGAYRRSRRTVARVMEEDPHMMFDIHRDAVPQEVYAEKVDGTWITQVMFVVGRQNQNQQANLAFAKELKALADEIYPGLVRGIFMARGNYNQDMFTRNLLLEVGAHTNARESAERGIAKFSEVVTEYLRRQAEQ